MINKYSIHPLHIPPSSSWKYPALECQAWRWLIENPSARSPKSNSKHWARNQRPKHTMMMVFVEKSLNWTRMYRFGSASLPPHRNVEWCSERSSTTIATPSWHSDQCCVWLYLAVVRSSLSSIASVCRAVAHRAIVHRFETSSSHRPFIELHHLHPSSRCPSSRSTLQRWQTFRLTTLDGIPGHVSWFPNDHFLDFRTSIRSIVTQFRIPEIVAAIRSVIGASESKALSTREMLRWQVPSLECGVSVE